VKKLTNSVLVEHVHRGGLKAFEKVTETSWAAGAGRRSARPKKVASTGDYLGFGILFRDAELFHDVLSVDSEEDVGGSSLFAASRLSRLRIFCTNSSRAEPFVSRSGIRNPIFTPRNPLIENGRAYRLLTSATRPGVSLLS
jgi:hypothetical protein